MSRSHLSPSYRNGFAPRDRAPKYPRLWDGCVGAWCPSLGVTGGTLRDWSGYRQHATLTNMDPATDWVFSGDGAALDFDGTDDVASATPTAAAVTGNYLSWGCWIRPAVQASFQMPFGVANGSTRQFAFFLSNSATSLFVDLFGGSVALSSAIAYSAWNHIMLVKDASTAYVYLNGKRVFTGTAGSISSVAGATVRIGSSTDWPYPGMIDDARIYNRALSPSEIALLASSRRVSYIPSSSVSVSVPSSGMAAMRARSVSIYEGMKPIGPGCMNCRTSLTPRQKPGRRS